MSHFCLYDLWSTETISIGRGKRSIGVSNCKKKNVLFNTLDVPWYPFPYIRFRQFPIRNLLSTLSAFPLKGIPVSLNWETLIVISLNTPRRAHRPFPSISEWEMAWAVFWVIFFRTLARRDWCYRKTEIRRVGRSARDHAGSI